MELHGQKPPHLTTCALPRSTPPTPAKSVCAWGGPRTSVSIQKQGAPPSGKEPGGHRLGAIGCRGSDQATDHPPPPPSLSSLRILVPLGWGWDGRTTILWALAPTGFLGRKQVCDQEPTYGLKGQLPFFYCLITRNVSLFKAVKSRPLLKN